MVIAYFPWGWKDGGDGYLYGPHGEEFLRWIPPRSGRVDSRHYNWTRRYVQKLVIKLKCNVPAPAMLTTDMRFTEAFKYYMDFLLAVENKVIDISQMVDESQWSVWN